MIWIHQRKGIIEGKIIRDDGEWVDIRVTKDINIFTLGKIHKSFYKKGEVITVRKSFLKEVNDDK